MLRRGILPQGTAASKPPCRLLTCLFPGLHFHLLGRGRRASPVRCCVRLLTLRWSHPWGASAVLASGTAG